MKSTVVINLQLTEIGEETDDRMHEVADRLAKCIKNILELDDVRVTDTKIFTHEEDENA